MYKSIWLIENDTQEIKVNYYHFKKNPQFPYFLTEMETVSIEWLWTLKLCKRIKLFWKCLTHDFEILSIRERKKIK